MHPGEKRLVSLCQKHCEYLPKNFQANLQTLLTSSNEPEKIVPVLGNIIEEIKQLVVKYME